MHEPRGASAVQRTPHNSPAAAAPASSLPRSLIVPLSSFLAGAAVLGGLLVPTWAPLILVGFALVCGVVVFRLTARGDLSRVELARGDAEPSAHARIVQRTRTLDRLL